MDTVAHGVVLGLVYGVLAAGLVLVYRTSRVVNFAHGQTGALGAAILAKLVLDEHWAPWLGLPVVLVLGGAIGAATQLLVARPLRNRPRLVLLVATIGLTQLLIVVQLLLPDIKEVAPYPALIHRQISFGSVVFTGRDFLPLAAVPAIVVGLTLWLLRTPSGRALRAVGDNPEAGTLAGIRRERVELAAWIVAGMVATATAVLANPLQGVIVGRPTESLGAGLMVRALAAALVGRLRSLPWALVGGLVVGVLQAIATSGGVDPAVADVLLLGFVLAAVLVVGRDDIDGDAPLVRVAVAPRRPAWTFGLALLAAAVVPFVFSGSSQLFSLSRVALYAIVGLSLVVLTGWAGQLSLGQFALVGVGAFSAAVLMRHGTPFLGALVVATLVGALVSVLIGLPALRIRGLELAVTTLALAVACGTWVFTRPGLLDRGRLVTVVRPEPLRGSRAFYEACVLSLAAAAMLIASIRRTDLGRRLLAVRSNESGASVLGVSPTATKLTAFAIAGALAAAAGVMLAALRVRSAAGDFGPDESLRIVAITVIGGAGGPLGAILGAAFVLGVPAIFGDTTIAGLLPSGLGLLVLALLLPGGLAEIARKLGSRLLPSAPPRVPASCAAGVDPHPAIGAGLRVRGLTVEFGGRVALDGVDLLVEPGSLVGLVGPNGAGKTTLLDAITGFVAPSAGSIELDGSPMTSQSAAARAGAGVGRVLQDGGLFEDLTVCEVVTLAAGRGGEARARAVLERMAVAPSLLDRPCQELATGTRRLVELAAAAVRSPRLLLLDEPSAGLGRDETDRLAPLLRALHQELGCTIVLVEHDVDLVVAVAQRLVCLSGGRVVADGVPEEVLAHPDVASSYLGR